MNVRANERQLSVSDITGPEFRERIGEALEELQGLTSQHIRRQMPEEQVLRIGERSTSLVVVEPSGSDVDEETTITMGLPHKNGWTPQHYIGARLLQRAVAPNSRVIVFPNDSFGVMNHRYTKEDKHHLKDGDGFPEAWAQMTALEGLTDTLGLANIWATGYSKGARQALELAAVGSSLLNVAKVNADETPSKADRGVVGLGWDFFRSGLGVSGSEKKAGLPPGLAKAMQPYGFNAEFVKFVLAHLGPNTVSDVKVMTGSAGPLISEAVHQVGRGNIKLGMVEGSRMFDPSTIPEHLSDAVRLEYYQGEGFLAHASGDNVILQAAMAYRGLAD